ncbi:MAG TPA: hypothetical protein VHX37_06765 [Acidobacteriaceae bacterium]|nr:hypothetical protein [Acidobacteriaceae bacterium]
MTLRIGAVWMLLNLVAAAFLGAEFIVQEVRSLISRRHQPHGDSSITSIASGRTSARRA